MSLYWLNDRLAYGRKTEPQAKSIDIVSEKGFVVKANGNGLYNDIIFACSCSTVSKNECRMLLTSVREGSNFWPRSARIIVLRSVGRKAEMATLWKEEMWIKQTNSISKRSLSLIE